MIAAWWDAYWSWVGGNIGAMPLQALISLAAALLLVRPIKRAWHHLAGKHITAAREAAERAHRIAADLYEHHTGQRHPDAPASESEAR